jgi:ferredoxin-thioredoxin reductase catalytic subunit
MSKMKTLDEVREYVRKIAKRNNWRLNSSEEMLQTLVAGLMKNYNRLGYYNCPCRDSQEDKTIDRDIICPCVYARESDVEEYGHCYCALFFSHDFDMSEEIRMIPERRPAPQNRRPGKR